MQLSVSERLLYSRSVKRASRKELHSFKETLTAEEFQVLLSTFVTQCKDEIKPSEHTDVGLLNKLKSKLVNNAAAVRTKQPPRFVTNKTS